MYLYEIDHSRQEQSSDALFDSYHRYNKPALYTNLAINLTKLWNAGVVNLVPQALTLPIVDE